MTTPRAFTLIELLIVITILAIAFTLTLPHFVLARDEAKEDEAKANLRVIQVALSRYHSNHLRYPPFLLGGDPRGWEAWHAKYDEPTPDRTLPQNAWVHDPLLRYGYLASYPTNPFVGKDGLAVIQQTGPIKPEGESYHAGEGDPRFGFEGNLMGMGLDDQRYGACCTDNFELPPVDTRRTLRAASGNPDALPYAMGGRRARSPDGGFSTVYTHWPGSFFYRSEGFRMGTKGHFPLAPHLTYRQGNALVYMLGVYGAFTAGGFDLIRFEARDPLGQELYYRYPPDWRISREYRHDFSLESFAYDCDGVPLEALPELFGGGDQWRAPYLPYYRNPDLQSGYLIGAPDGHPDGVIMVMYQALKGVSVTKAF